MLEVGKRYENPRTGTWIQIVERAPDLLRFERLFKPNTGKADPHFHQDFTQTWEAIQGEGEIEVEGEPRTFSAGDRVALTPNTPHRDPYNPGDGDFIARATFEPVPEFIEAFGSALGHHLEQDTTNDQDDIPLLQILMIARATDGRSYRAGVPVALQRAGLPLVAAIGRLRGYRASYD